MAWRAAGRRNDAEGGEPDDPFPQCAGRPSGRRRRRLLDRGGAERGAGRRIRLRQDSHLPQHPGHPAARGEGGRRLHPVRPGGGGGQSAAPAAVGPARHPRQPHLDDLPGADERAVAAPQHRRPDHGGAAAARQLQPPKRPRQVPRHVRAGGLPRSAARLPLLPVPAVGRPAPAGDDRHGDGGPSAAADRRRTHHGAGRDAAGPGAGADQGAAGGDRHGGTAGHP